jgi:hypothetical protein
MTYQQFGKVEADDFNNFAGNSTVSTTVNAINTTWGVGNGQYGYGQTPVQNVDIGGRVEAANWKSLIDTNFTASQHKNVSIANIAAPTTGSTIEFLSTLSTALSTVYNNRFRAGAQGSTVAHTRTLTTTWSNQALFTFTCTFANADSARYFFNAGGQLAITFSHPTGTGINAMMNSLGVACGTVVISAMNSGNAVIAGTTYNGITKIGGSGTVDLISPNLGYYGVTTTAQTQFRQKATGTPSGYTESFISVDARTNGTQGTNGDNGSILTIRALWDQVPNGLVVSANTTTTLTVRNPSTSYLTNTWGNVNVTSSVTGT